MFTGIVQEVGTVAGVTHRAGGVVIAVRAPACGKELRVDDSVAIDGVCQTVVRSSGNKFEVEAVEETLKKTTLGTLQNGEKVNLELALRMGDRLGGHLVQGHVDCVGDVTGVEKRAMSSMVRIAFPHEFARYIIPVGSVAVDGISLTVASVEGNVFVVSVIPHTLENTTLGAIAAGAKVNLEFDLVGKYIEKLVTGGGSSRAGLSAEKLAGWGFSS